MKHLDERIVEATNELLNAELWSANCYLSLQIYFEQNRLPVLASWLSRQSAESYARAYRLMEHLYHYGAGVTVNAMRQPADKWRSPLEALNALTGHEQYLQKRIKAYLTLTNHLAPTFYTEMERLYSRRVATAGLFVEMLWIWRRECRSRLPLLE